MPGARRRAPARKERRKQKGEILVTRDFNQARGKLFNAGIYLGKKGSGLLYFVKTRSKSMLSSSS